MCIIFAVCGEEEEDQEEKPIREEIQKLLEERI